MSRPNTRNKNKRPLKESENSFSEILRKIHLTGEITKSDIRQLYSVSKPTCSNCRTNSKENPNCFCALVPPSTNNRKSGLWQKTQDQLLSLGPNPNKDLRPNQNTPAGLTNLGATCYANSILQCLYMNTSFRAGIFSLETGLVTQYPVLCQLARLFAQLHSSNMGFIDSAPFIKTLELDNGVQQDSHEFLTLFLSLLERSLSNSRVQSAKTVVQDLFRGTVSHVTRCSKCGKDSEASSKMEDFYELELNIKDLKTLDESLEQYLSIEDLQGDNQYFCDSCNIRVDATRCIKLRSLPNVLNLQLKRYVFLPKTTTKKKITSSFSFPRRLDMRKRLSLTDPVPDNSEPGFIYELSAILIHKGTTVNSGHYVAHIKDESTGIWWEFDDELVSKLGPHPFGEKDKDKDKESTSKTKNNNNNGNNNNNTTTTTTTTNNNNNNNNDSNNNSNLDNGSSICNGKHQHVEKEEEEMFSSNDCYMLMYKQTIVNKENGTYTNGNNNNNNNNNSILPSYYREEIEKLNEAYERECKEYRRLKDEKLAFITERREEVKSVLSEASINNENEEEIYFWISTEWLKQWADNIEPPPLDNSAILCQHGKVPVSKVNSMKRISAMAWQLLHSKYGGGPALSSEDYCGECLKSGADNAVSADMYREQKESLKDLAESALAGKLSPRPPSYFVSRMWLVHWLRRKNSEKPCDTDVGPTSALTCPHGGLLPEQASGAKRVSIPENFWLFLYETFNNNKTDRDDIATFPSDLPPCEFCYVKLSEVACVEDNLRAMKSKLRQNHEKLLTGKSFALSQEQNYNLVPAKWLTQWRSYVTSIGKNISSVPEPDNLETTLDSLICQKHSLLLERPLELVCKRGINIITQKLSSSEGLIIIPEANWIKLCEEWNVPTSKGIFCQIAFINNNHENNNNNNNNDKNKEENKIPGSKDEPISIEDNNNMDITIEEINEDPDPRKPYIKTRPQVCEECIGERESCLLMEKLNYQNGNICVYFVRGKEAPKSIQNVSNSNSDPERRVSKRSRKSSNADSISLTVSGSTSLYQLKMMIWEAFGVVRENQKLHKGSVEIEGDTDTLADKNIFPGDVLWVKDSEIHENRDIADELDEVSEGKPDVKKKTEEGFRGTLLTSDMSNIIYGQTSQN